MWATEGVSLGLWSIFLPILLDDRDPLHATGLLIMSSFVLGNEQYKTGRLKLGSDVIPVHSLDVLVAQP